MPSASVVALWDEFQNLTAHQRRVVFHMYWDGHTEEETAETMGVSRSTVCRALVNAEKHFKNSLESVTQKGGPQLVVHVREENGAAQRDTGRRPTAQGAHKAVVSLDRPADSQCPPPDIYDALLFGGRQSKDMPARDVFLEELNHVCASAFLQLMDAGSYNAGAEKNRERIARDRRKLNA